MPGVSGNQQDVDIDLGQLVRAIWRRRLRIFAATAVCVGLAFVAAKVLTPQYRSETRILIEPRAPAFAATAAASEPGTGPLLDELNIASQVQILQSADLIKQVIGKLKLYDLPEFDQANNASALSDILVALGLKKSPLDNAPEERVIDAFVERLQVYQVNTSRVIGINFTSRDPKLAAAVPNAIVDAYLAIQSGAKLDSNSEATRWLEPEIANLREKVTEAEKKVAEYRASSGLLPTGDTTTFPVRQLGDISAELARVRGEKANAEAKAKAVREALKSGRPTDMLPEVVGAESIQRLKTTESGLESQISDLSTSMLDGHPRMKSLRAQLADIRAQIKRETQKILASLENEARTADLREQQLVQQSNTLKANSARAGEDQVGLNALEREAAAQRQLLETYLSRYREAASRSDRNSSPADARVVSKAVLPIDPYFPKVVPIVIVAAVASLVLSSVFVMLAELFSGRALRPVNEVEMPANRQASTAGEPPRDGDPAVTPAMMEAAESDLHKEGSAISADGDGQEADEDYSIQSVADYLAEEEGRIVISVSPTGDNGSTAVVMLARMSADAGRRVILVDMTASACPTRLMADDREAAGITDLLCGEAAFAETIHGDRLSDAHVVPQGTSDVRRAMRGIDRLSLILDALSSAYDLVLVECGPADVASVSRLTRDKDIEVVLSMPVMDEELFVAAMTEFGEAGYDRLILMSGVRDDNAQGGLRAA
ncbi:Wzz/FepE/Etk N-terminal domain-containing protein [Rhizobium sp. BK251]|uniref:GumC family protein n=1 Tax=Rhizobium sp. BK251 TaxID=2512125 RepID=UPI00104C3ABD|nr:Wzz/FepE/Etk N-terminal domain-containing protein [Rhizobium sp. BK251]TCL70334.1 exopolysaccharide transport family protein [Rhizobium sp. BK251]